MSKIRRQLHLYDRIFDIPPVSDPRGTIIGPDELMGILGISRRMLQRDLKDIRDCGLINARYDRKRNRYLDAGGAVFDESAGERRKQHLRRLYRLGTLITKLSRTPYEDIENYECAVRNYNELLEMHEEDPETITQESLEAELEYMPDEPEFYDLKAEYYALFPDSNERTRQRDFKELHDAGFPIYYSSDYKTYIFETETDDL